MILPCPPSAQTPLAWLLLEVRDPAESDRPTRRRRTTFDEQILSTRQTPSLSAVLSASALAACLRLSRSLPRTGSTTSTFINDNETRMRQRRCVDLESRNTTCQTSKCRRLAGRWSWQKRYCAGESVGTRKNDDNLNSHPSLLLLRCCSQGFGFEHLLTGFTMLHTRMQDVNF